MELSSAGQNNRGAGDMETQTLAPSGMGLLIASHLDDSPDCIKIIGADGALKYMNRAGCVALGIELSELDGVLWVSLLPRQVHDAALLALSEAKGGKSSRFKGLSEGDSGVLTHWDNVLTPLVGASGLVEDILCISRDVTPEDGPHHDRAGAVPGDPAESRKFPRRSAASRSASSAGVASLTYRERECLLWTRLGKTAWETSVILNISRRTVEFHIRNATRKLNAINKYDASNIVFDADARRTS